MYDGEFLCPVRKKIYRQLIINSFNLPRCLRIASRAYRFTSYLECRREKIGCEFEKVERAVSIFTLIVEIIINSYPFAMYCSSRLLASARVMISLTAIKVTIDEQHRRTRLPDVFEEVSTLRNAFSGENSVAFIWHLFHIKRMDHHTALR